ncbi:MAG: hypothetical protein HYY93_03425 [Planctomycetes bacterium]|nr:hypothetical protein [Planctomycetota bacterium]
MKRPYRNLHVPLRPESYETLISECRRSGRPATQVAREAIEWWIELKERLDRERSLAGYVEKVAGTAHDLDPALERAGIELMLARQPKRRRHPK